MTQENITTQGNVSYLPWVVPPSTNIDVEPLDTQFSDTEQQHEAASVANVTVVDPSELQQQLHEIALRALGRKDYSRKELGRYLQKRFTVLTEPVDVEGTDDLAQATHPVDSESLIASVLTRLETQGWLDEVRAIEALLLRSQYRQLGQQAKRQKLQQLGYSEAAIQGVLAAADMDEEYQQLRELAEKRNAQLQNLDDEVRERRLISYLMRRGYASTQVFAVVRQLGQYD